VEPTHRPLAGLQQNNRGQTVIVPGDVSGVTKVASIVETPRSNGDDAEVITVTLGLEFDGQEPGFNPNLAITFTANLTWGIGGASFSADVDWIGGTAFSIAASWVRVGATYEAPPAGFGGPGPAALLTASLAYGYNGLDGTRRLTDQGALGALNVGATRSFVVPRFATAVGFSIPAQTDLEIAFLTGTGANQLTTGGFRYNDRTNTGVQQQPFPLPNSTFVMNVTNNGPAVLPPNTFAGSIIWYLSF
jgi:hypothetical protein